MYSFILIFDKNYSLLELKNLKKKIWKLTLEANWHGCVLIFLYFACEDATVQNSLAMVVL